MVIYRDSVINDIFTNALNVNNSRFYVYANLKYVLIPSLLFGYNIAQVNSVETSSCSWFGSVDLS